MTREELEQIAHRESYCAPFETKVAITGKERDELVALARDGMLMRWMDQFAHSADWVPGEPRKLIICADTGEEFYGETWKSAIAAAMAEEGA